MKSQKVNDALWRITAPNGQHADLSAELQLGVPTGKWFVMINGVQFGDAHRNRFDAKVAAEQLLNGG